MCNHRFSLFVCLAVGTITWAGCSGGTTTVAIPSFDPEGSAEKAMELYDTDGDGALSDSELDAAPGIKAAIRNLDSDSDGKVSSEEIAARIPSLGRTEDWLDLDQLRSLHGWAAIGWSNDHFRAGEHSRRCGQERRWQDWLNWNLQSQDPQRPTTDP